MALKNVDYIPLLLIQRVCLNGTPPYKCVSAHVGLGNLILGRPQQKNMLCFWGIWIWLKISTNDWPKVRIANSDDFNPKKHEILDFVAKGKSKSSIKWDGQKNVCKHRGLGKHFENMSNTCSPKLDWQKPHFFNPTRFLLQRQTAQRLCGTCSAAHPILCGRCTRFGFLKGCRVTRCMLKKYYSYIKFIKWQFIQSSIESVVIQLTI